MSTQYVLTLALCIGIVAGLRAMTAPALVSWAARLHWLNLYGSPLSFMESTIVVVVLSLGAIGEYINDKRPNTPSRTAPLSFIARLVTGGASGACLCVSAGRSLALGGFMGALGAVIGTLGGYLARTRLVKALNVRDVFVAIPEDLIAIAVGFLTISLAFTR